MDLKKIYKSQFFRRQILNLINIRKLSLKIVMKILISINKVWVIGRIDRNWIHNSSSKKVRNWSVNLNLREVWLLDKLWVGLANVGRSVKVLMMDIFKKALYLLMVLVLHNNQWLFMRGDLMIIIKWEIYLLLETLGR